MSDVIAAISTAAAVSAIGIVRMSGDGAIEIASGVFRPYFGGPLEKAPDRKLILGDIIGENGMPLDSCLATVSRGPGSYTGEDTAEFQCHGSPVVLAELLRLLFGAGARQALRGEFTKRAFLNGRMDLSGAEAVIDIIEAETPEAAQNAVGQLGGAIFEKVNSVYDILTGVLSHFHAVVDFPDEDVEPFENEAALSSLREAQAALEKLSAGFSRGQILRDGVRCAIIGRPNAGKSSLLNTLLGFERAIVTPIAGTTRDVVEEKARIGGVLLRLSDTAGLRETDDPVESIGVSRARSAAESAQLVLAVFDGSEPLSADDEDTFAAAASSGAPVIPVVNKTDLPLGADISTIENRLGEKVCFVSAKESSGMDELSARVARLFENSSIPIGEIITNARQAEAIKRALESVEAAASGFEAGITPDAVLTEAETALEALGEITGRTVRDDVIEDIFSRFCVGK